MTSRDTLVRGLWTLFEPIHAVTYFSAESRAAFAAIGLTRYWDGYFAGRSAPLGAVTAAPVTALFSGFAPALVERALPAAWSIASPDAVLDARAAGAASTLRTLVPDEDVAARAATALAPIAAEVDTIGRPLAAANRALPTTGDPYRDLWQATATLREHRGDGHVLALVTENIAGLTTIVLRSGLDLDTSSMKRSRGWSDEEWDDEQSDLVDRGMLDSDGLITPAGRDTIDRAEQLTNRLATAPWSGLSDARLAAVAAALAPLANACAPLYPQPNPIGMPTPWDAAADPAGATILAGPASR
ncbi:hypothetical protein B7R21_05155 [Subtercola boreus]|uniref:SalK n=1 Tax=Subtercola boreus TaxID=120213 RepID=A0A3E0VZ85_9MICO|nr:hypothetical protein [Subtercola boreus]RFA15404.1 hypothetical protein B7R21_05155 [Subtercola boreus]